MIEALASPPPRKRSVPICMYAAGSGSLRTWNVNLPIWRDLPLALDATEIVTSLPTADGRAMYLPMPIERNEPPDIEADTALRGTPGMLTLIGLS